MVGRRGKTCLFDCSEFYYAAILFILCFIDASQSWATDYLFCNQKGLCSCANSNGDLIDLQPLATTSQPLLAASTSYLYMYHPCVDSPLNSSEKNDCQKSYGICYFVPSKATQEPVNFDKVLANQTLGNYKRLALNDEAVFRVSGVNEIEIVYKNQDGDNILTTIVKLHCNEKIDDYKLTVEQSNPLEHVLSLTTKYVCTKSHHQMSGVAIFFLILFIIAIFYFICGILVLKFIRGALGVEMIPNYTFWCSIVNLAKGAFNYLKSCKSNTSDSYEKI